MQGMNRADSLFIGHGSPMNAVLENDYTRALATEAGTMRRPAAIVVISAHWQTRGTHITASKAPPQIYDFYGFPDDLYAVRYSPPGLPALARSIEAEGLGIKADAERGIDHAAWAVVKHMFPDQDIPVLELSLDHGKSFPEHFALARSLAKFRDQNILFIGSGNLVHNLGDVSYDLDAQPFKWARDMDAWFKARIASLSVGELLDYPAHLKDYARGIPSTEHYLPFVYALGMMLPGERARTIHESIQNGSISMRSIGIGA